MRRSHERLSSGIGLSPNGNSVGPGDTPVTISRAQHVSVCICTYKRPALLRRLLEGLGDQERSELFTFSIAAHPQLAGREGRKVLGVGAAASGPGRAPRSGWGSSGRRRREATPAERRRRRAPSVRWGCLRGGSSDESAARAAIDGARPLEHNEYKVALVKKLVRAALTELAQ